MQIPLFVNTHVVAGMKSATVVLKAGTWGLLFNHKTPVLRILVNRQPVEPFSTTLAIPDVSLVAVEVIESNDPSPFNLHLECLSQQVPLSQN